MKCLLLSLGWWQRIYQEIHSYWWSDLIVVDYLETIQHYRIPLNKEQITEKQFYAQ